METLESSMKFKYISKTIITIRATGFEDETHGYKKTYFFGDLYINYTF